MSAPATQPSATRSRLAPFHEGSPAWLMLEVLDIPYIATPPLLDGSISADEWRGARRIALTPQALGTEVHVAGDERYLYFAADVPADTTGEGFDQFRVWFHIGLSPWLDNERAFVGRVGEVSALRQTRFPWGDNPPPAWAAPAATPSRCGFASVRNERCAGAVQSLVRNRSKIMV